MPRSTRTFVLKDETRRLRTPLVFGKRGLTCSVTRVPPQTKGKKAANEAQSRIGHQSLRGVVVTGTNAEDTRKQQISIWKKAGCRKEIILDTPETKADLPQ